MAGRYKKICYLCGKEYQYCSNCRDYKTQPTWKNMFHDENCHKLFNLSTQFAQGYYTEEEAKKILAECDLTNIDSFREDVIEQIKIIQNSKPIVTEEKAEKQVETKYESKVETKDNKDDNTETVLPEVSEFKRKKKTMKKSSDKKVFNEQ